MRDLFDRCLDLAYFPQAWHLAEVSMLPEVGKKDRTSPRSWRPIALLSFVGKGLERLLAKRIAWTALTHDLLSPQLGGALPKRSTMDLVASFVHEAERALAKNLRVSMVTMDVQGAFDALLKRRLLQRLRKLHREARRVLGRRVRLQRRSRPRRPALLLLGRSS